MNNYRYAVVEKMVTVKMMVRISQNLILQKTMMMNELGQFLKISMIGMHDMQFFSRKMVRRRGQSFLFYHFCTLLVVVFVHHRNNRMQWNMCHYHFCYCRHCCCRCYFPWFVFCCLDRFGEQSKDLIGVVCCRC